MHITAAYDVQSTNHPICTTNIKVIYGRAVGKVGGAGLAYKKMFKWPWLLNPKLRP